jgi:hypothetical protein
MTEQNERYTQGAYSAVTEALHRWPRVDPQLPIEAFTAAEQLLTPAVMFGANQSAQGRELTRRQTVRLVKAQLCKDFGVSMLLTPLLWWQLIHLVAFIVQAVMELRRRQAAEGGGGT